VRFSCTNDPLKPLVHCIPISSYFAQYIQLPVVDVLRYKRNSVGFLPWLCVYTLPSELGGIVMGKPNSHQPLEPLGKFIPPEVEMKPYINT
jgi:hypothetical protein